MCPVVEMLFRLANSSAYCSRPGEGMQHEPQVVALWHVQ